ncbi:hypothetical protein G195_009730 [Phytophthora kernoviae 00238/432]|uniref:Thioredoxin domain-containing protein n=1 Tax=Phytophthora kernoviae 00238/432 TaxID=1284355 RepID=A0A8J4W1Y0_9STRA|nr:hypothetical protein G195_009730 [Phytophthora kernoviae 00238/432]
MEHSTEKRMVKILLAELTIAFRNDCELSREREQPTMQGVALFVYAAVACLLAGVQASMYTDEDNVYNLDPESFKELVEQDSAVWMIEFYAPWCGHCKELTPEYKKAAKALEGVVKVAAIDCQEHEEFIQQYAVQGFPTIKFFGDNKYKPTTFDGDRTAKGIVDGALAASRKVVKARLGGGEKKKKKPKTQKKPSKASSNVITLTDDTFDTSVLNSGEVWMVEFYAPWCGHCKALAPDWEQAATELKGSIKFAALDATANERVAAQYGIQSFPTIKVFSPTSVSPKDVLDYDGERTAAAITEFGLKTLDGLGVGVKATELTSADVLTDFCDGKSSCIISVLPHITEGGKSGRENYLSTLEEAAKVVRGKPFRFGWMQGGDQLAFENQFELTFGYPSLVAISLDRKRYVVQRGAFTTEAISEFLLGVMQGRESTVGFDELPAIETVKPWDGKDVQLDEIEEDEDDDIMNEILGGAEKDEL